MMPGELIILGVLCLMYVDTLAGVHPSGMAATWVLALIGTAGMVLASVGLWQVLR